MVNSTENVQHCPETATTEEHAPNTMAQYYAQYYGPILHAPNTMVPDIAEQSGWSERKKIALGLTLGIITLCLIVGLALELANQYNKWLK